MTCFAYRQGMPPEPTIPQGENNKSGRQGQRNLSRWRVGALSSAGLLSREQLNDTLR